MSELEITNHFHWLIDYQLQLTQGTTYSKSIAQKVRGLFVHYLRLSRRESTIAKDLLCSVLLLQMGQAIHIQLIIRDCCAIIESHAYSVGWTDSCSIEEQYLHLRAWEMLASMLGPLTRPKPPSANSKKTSKKQQPRSSSKLAIPSISTSHHRSKTSRVSKRKHPQCHLLNEFIQSKEDWTNSLLSQSSLGPCVEYIRADEVNFVMKSNFMQQLLQKKSLSISSNSWFRPELMKRATAMFVASCHDVLEEEEDEDDEQGPSPSSPHPLFKIKKQRTESSDDGLDVGTDDEDDVALLRSSKQTNQVTKNGISSSNERNEIEKLEDAFIQVLSGSEEGERFLSHFLFQGSISTATAITTATNAEDLCPLIVPCTTAATIAATAVNSTTTTNSTTPLHSSTAEHNVDEERKRDLFRVQYRNYPVNECDLWMTKHRKKNPKRMIFASKVSFPFSELGDRQLDLLTSQIIVSAHLSGIDSAFVCRGVQIILQHAILLSCDFVHHSRSYKDPNIRIRYKINNTKQTHAHRCLATLSQYNIDIVRVAQLAVEAAVSEQTTTTPAEI